MKAKAPFDPRYDPLVATTPGCGREYAPTYWVHTAGVAPEDDGALDDDVEADAVVVGSGFTGLCCAIFLAEQGVRTVVLEANQTSWGCSVRNGGQAQFSAGRLSRSQWIARYGLETARALHQEMLDGFATFRTLIADIDCDPQDFGHLYIAHRAALVAKITAEAKLLRQTFGYDASILTVDQLAADYFCDNEACGAMKEADGIGVHAAKLAFGYLKKARALGVKVFVASPVIGCQSSDGMQLLMTEKGSVRAPLVGFCTGGYTSNQLHPSLRNKVMPVLSNSLVTRPLTPSERDACQFQSTAIITDTRTLRHYYRLLPDNRLQIGSRSAIVGRNASQAVFKQILIAGMQRKFPALAGIDIDYYWWGWVDVSHDMMPRITQSKQHQGVFYALGYGGNGVMYSAQAGKRLAQLMTQQALPTLPIFDSELPYPIALYRFESEFFAPFRRLGQWVLYRWYQLRDEWRI